MARKASEQLVQLLAPVIAGLGYELVGVEWDKSSRGRILRVYIDAEDGITLADCERVSAQVGALLDVEDPIAGTYLLEVSSPGVDRPLFTLEQYRRFLGHKAQLKLKLPLAGRRRFTGVIAEVENGWVILESAGGKTAIPFENIEQARLVPDYQALLKG
ncbi:ribosome maturation factor RimP [Methylothermus subterraneus]